MNKCDLNYILRQNISVDLLGQFGQDFINEGTHFLDINVFQSSKPTADLGSLNLRENLIWN